MTHSSTGEPPPPDFSATELAPKLLLAPFAVQTRWYVITGVLYCGKTTLIEQLAGQGYQTVAEIARRYIEGEVAQGQTIAEIRADMDSLERTTMDLQVRAEEGLRARDLVFLDRGLPDCLTFYRLAGVDPNGHLAECLRHRYAGVFILDPLVFQRDGTRMDMDADIAGYLAAWHARDYSVLGYKVIRVPVLSPKERLAFVLERLPGRGWA